MKYYILYVLRSGREFSDTREVRWMLFHAQVIALQTIFLAQAKVLARKNVNASKNNPSNFADFRLHLRRSDFCTQWKH